MFNNPFDSFHNIVAEAKEEREQLDRLLTISTPRERLLVAAIALFLCILSAWLFFGSVARSLVVDGVVVEQSENSPGGGRSVQTLVWVERGIAPQIEAGMPVVIKPNTAGGETGALGGKVRAISAVLLSGGLAASESAAPMSLLRVDIALAKSPVLDSLAGRKCRIVIELGRQSPITLFRMRR
ncbi:MAG: hypothetical protein OXQ29_09315 [Rhodospirillaceae bacterium]|nr:hypothetical protein [Rhodospirillaceae bacterium]